MRLWRRYAVGLAATLAVALLGLIAPAFAQAESIEISPSAEPTQDVPVSIKVSGVADGHHKLWVFVNTSGGCGSTPEYDFGSSLASGTTLSAGSFEKTYSYTPTSIQTYTLCAYLDENEFASPDVTAESSFTAAMPAASAAIEIKGKLTQNIPMKIEVAGTTEVARHLYVLVNTSGGCGSTPEYDFGSSLASGTSISAGSWSGEYSYTPTSIQSYTVCAYVDENEFATPDATATSSFTAGTPAASVSIAVSPSSSENGPVSIKVSGTTEVARKLYVLVNNSGGCGSTPEYDFGSSLANGTSITPSAYSGEYSYTPTSTATYSICGYVDENEFATPDATGSATFTNVTPATKTAEAKLAEEHANAAAEETARRSAEADNLAGYLHGVAERRHCGELSEEYNRADVEACKSDEAAMVAVEEQQIRAEEAALAAQRAAAHKRPVRHLSVKPVTHTGHSSTDPGYTDLDITTSPYAHVVVKLSRYGHSTEHFEWGSHSTEVAEVIRWSCKSPGGTYRYVITARSNVGPTLTRHGHFAPVSVTTCHQYEQKEAEARASHEREAIAGYEQEVREERERRERYETNCRKLGGEPVELQVGSEYRIYCRAPGGGTIPVPY
jgi:hypothetical protein